MTALADLPIGEDSLPLGWAEDYDGIVSAAEQVAAWAEAVLTQPDGVQAGEPWRFTVAQLRFLSWYYAMDAATGRFLWRRAIAVLPKGAGKSPLAAAVGCCELAGPVVFDHLDEHGEPIMRPHPSPYVSLSALSLGQAADATMSLGRAMLDNPTARRMVPGLDVGLTRVRTRTGQMLPSTASAPSKEGVRLSAAILDETHLWTKSNRGTDLAATIRRNLAKGSGRSLELTNRWEIGAHSVAEQTAEYRDAVAAGRHDGDGLLMWAPVAPVGDLGDDTEVRAALEVLYADSPWVDLDRIMAEIKDAGTSAADTRRFYLNQSAAADNAYLPPAAWAACEDKTKTLQPDDLITLGFDGSRGRGEGFPDATALVAVRINDGFVSTLLVDEAGRDEQGWEPNVAAVEAAIEDAFKTYRVRGFFADPALWRTEVKTWERKYGRRLRAKANGDRSPIGYQTNRVREVTAAFDGLYQSVIDGELTHDGHDDLNRHALNARRIVVGGRIGVAKEFDRSPRKIDAIYALMLAWEARLACIRDGLTGDRTAGRSRVILL